MTKNFGKIFTVNFPYVLTIKSKVEISKNFVAFSEYMTLLTIAEQKFNFSRKHTKVYQNKKTGS